MQIRIRGRSFMAFVVLPEAPLVPWLTALRGQIAKAPGFFNARPVIVDFAHLSPGTEGVATLLTDIEALGITVIDVENIGDIPCAAPFRRHLLGGRPTGVVEIKPTVRPAPEAAGGGADASAGASMPPEPAQSTPGLIVEDHVRSGQSVLFPKGDVTVLGSVSSGAEILAGGSIHIYGALRGRALAGAQGFARARIFCRKLEAELVSIDGFYMTAEDMDPEMRGAAVQISLESGRITIAQQR
ncbi:MAG: septum site-determining protein MinC [Alphaproteobacteria bacterium]|nr:septum site-determining protein MinC [Alphaproteobacteria bacterium]